MYIIMVYFRSAHMIKLLYGTTNEAKITSMKHMLRGINVSLVNSGSYDLHKIKIDENGKTPVENAKIKALTFYEAYKVPVFSCDTGLYFKGSAHKYSPMCAVRRINGKYLNDDEMIEYYANLAKDHDGQLTAYYQNAISLVLSPNEIYSYDGEELNSEDFIITSAPHRHRTKGYPLDSLSIHLKSGKFYMDLRADTAHSYVLKKDLSEGFCNFFLDNLNGTHKLYNRR